MPISATHYRTVIAFVLVLLLGTGCSDQDSTPTPGPESTEASSSTEQVTEAAAPTVEKTAPEASQAVVELKTEAIEQQASASAEVASAAEKLAVVDGQKIYMTYCQACHANGVAGSPKFGDKAAWTPRIAKGNDALFSSVKNGLNAMPPKGACMTCSDDDLRAAIVYMVEQGS